MRARCKWISQASQLDVQDLVKLSGQQVPVTGTLAANVNVHGTQLSPMGQGNVSLTHVTAYDQPVTSATLTFAGTGEEVHGDLGVQLPAGNVQSKVSVRPRQKSYIAQLTAIGHPSGSTAGAQGAECQRHGSGEHPGQWGGNV